MGYIKEYLGNVKASNKFLVVVFLISGLFLLSHKLSSSSPVDGQQSLATVKNEELAISSKKAPQKLELSTEVKPLPKKEKAFNLDDCLLESMSSYKNKANLVDVAIVYNFSSEVYEKLIVDELIAKNFKSKKYRIHPQKSLKDCVKNVGYDNFSKGNFQAYFDYVLVINHEREYKVLDMFKGEQICRQYMSARVYDTSKKEWIYHESPDMATHHTSFAEMDNGFEERNRGEVVSFLDSLDFPF